MEQVIKIEGEAHCQTFTVECTVKNVPNIDRTFIVFESIEFCTREGVFGGYFLENVG